MFSSDAEEEEEDTLQELCELREPSPTVPHARVVDAFFVEP